MTTFDNFDGLSRTESKIETYLSKIRHLDGSFKADETKDVHVGEVGSIEQLHRSGPLNRHIYFAGIPLSHSLQSLKYMRQFSKLKSRNAELEKEVERLNKEIDQLHENAQVNFYKFEVALGKAMQIGVACNKLSRTISDHNRVSKRRFIGKLREKCIIRAHRKRFTKKHRNLAVTIICNRIHKMVFPAIYSVFTVIRQNARFALLGTQKGPPKIPNIPATKVVFKDEVVTREKTTTHEDTLLFRLESLVKQEMEMLNSARQTDDFDLPSLNGPSDEP